MGEKPLEFDVYQAMDTAAPGNPGRRVHQAGIEANGRSGLPPERVEAAGGDAGGGVSPDCLGYSPFANSGSYGFSKGVRDALDVQVKQGVFV